MKIGTRHFRISAVNRKFHACCLRSFRLVVAVAVSLATRVLLPRTCTRVPLRAATGRLQGRSSFYRLRTSGQRIRRGPLSATVLHTGEPARIGFALPASLGNAVVRNRLRRRLRAIAMSKQDLPKADIVIRPHPACVALSYKGLEGLFIELMTQAAGAPSSRTSP